MCSGDATVDCFSSGVEPGGVLLPICLIKYKNNE